MGLAGGYGKGYRARMGGGLGRPKRGVAQKLGKTRQNGPYGVFRGPPIPTYTPDPENRATAVLTPFPGIPPSHENPDSRSADETPTDYPVPAAHGSTPVWVWVVRADAEAQKPRTRRGQFQHHLSDYAGCIVLNASGIFRLCDLLSRFQARRADPPRPHHHPRRVPP